MAGFTDLVQQAQPAMAEVIGRGTEGRTWRHEFANVTDANGDDVDLRESAGVTGSCLVQDAVKGTTVVEFTFTGSLGSFVIEADATVTAGTATGATSRACVWGLVLTKGEESVQVWSPKASLFTIDPE